MNGLVNRDFCAVLVLSLGHFLWQGTLLAALAAVVAKRLKTTHARYGCLVVALGLMAISPFVTLAIHAARSEKATSSDVAMTTQPTAVQPVIEVDSPTLSAAEPTVFVEPMSRDVFQNEMTAVPTTAPPVERPVPTNDSGWQRFAPLMMNVYLLGVVAMLLRLAAGLWGGRQLRLRSVPVTDATLLQALRCQAKSLGMTFVPVLAYCERVAVPTVIGILKPTILLPLALASGLTPEQVEAVLAHELAHLRRYDHLVNLMQRVIESLLFFHPAVWWLSNRIRIEREHCCDDLVVACGAVPLDYAKSLLRVAELSRGSNLHRSVSAVSLLATGQPSTLRQRIARLLGDSADTHVRFLHRWPVFGIVTVCLMLAGSASWIGWSVSAETMDQQVDEQTKRAVDSPDAANTNDAPPQADEVKVDDPAEALEPESKPISFTERRRIRAALREVTEVAFMNNPAEECLMYLGDLHGIKTELSPAARSVLAIGNQVTLQMKGDELRAALSLMLSPFGLTYMIEGNRLLITTPADLSQRGGTLPFDDSSLLAKLEQKYPNVAWTRLRRGEAGAGGVAAMRELMIALLDGDPRIQEEAAKRIWLFQEAVQAAVPSLEKLARSDDPQVRRSAYRTLARIGSKDLITFPAILAALESGDPVVRDDWLKLALICGAACLPHIEAAYPMASVETRKHLLTTSTIRQFRDPDHDTTWGLVRLGLADADADLRLQTLNIATRTRITEERTNAFRPFLHSASPDERLGVALYFAFTESEFKPAIDVLLESAFSGRDDQRRRSAWFNLHQLEYSRVAVKDYAVERLRARLDNLRGVEGMTAAQLVIWLTPLDATDLIRQLALKVREGGVNAPTAADVLANADSTPETRTALNRALAQADVAVRLKLAQAAKSDLYPADRIKLLLILLDDPNASVVEAALTAVASHQPVDPATLAKLNTLAESGPSAVRAATRRALSTLVISPSKPREMNLTEWGTATRDGLRTQLVLLTDTKAVGQPLLIGLRVRNDSTERRSVAENQAYDGRALEVIGPDGKPVESLIGDRQIHELAEFIEPGETLELADLAPRVSHRLSIPGTYTIRFVGNDTKPPKLIVPQTTRLPESNALIIKLTAALLESAPKPRAEQKTPPDGEDGANRVEQKATSVVGTVVSPDGKPVAGIEVLTFQGGKQLEQKFTTDERGEFRVPKAWREVDHWLTVVARDGRERLGWFDFMIHGHSDSGQKVEDGSFRLVLLPMSRTIRGRVLDESGQPLAQIPVRINQLDHEVNSTSVHWKYQKLGDEALVFGAVTDNDGWFELKLPANTFAWLGTSHPDWVESRIRVTKEQDEVADTKLVRAAKVSGRVIDSRTGKPLAGVTIAAHATKTEILESGGDEAKTDADGKFLIQGLRSGEYTIQLERSPFKTLTAPALAGAVLKPGETFKADFALNLGKRLTGRVLDMDTGEPISDCKVNCTSPAQPNGGLHVETNAQGEFEFIVPPGQSSLSSTEGRRFGNESTREVDVPADGDPEPVVLKVGEETESVPGSFKIFIGPPLDRKVSLHFQRAPLVEVLEHACQAAAVKLELDGDGLKSMGYTKNMPVTIDTDNVTLREALTQVLKPYEKLSFTLDKDRLFVSTRQQVEAREKQAAEPKPPTEDKKAGATSLPKGLEFLKPYPKLHGLSLDMTEPQFLEIVKQQELKTRKTAEGEKVTHHISLGDDHTLIVMFDKDAKCSGIQRVRGETVRAIEGLILSIDQKRGVAVISLGAGDTVKRLMKFEVRAKAPARDKADKPVVNGTVEVIRVEQDTSEVRILKQDLANKITEGDYVILVEEKTSAGNGPPELRTLRKPALLLPDHWIVQAVGFDNDGKELVTASNQSFITIRRWDVVGMKLISEIKLQADKHGRAVRDGTLMFSGDRRRVVAATDAYVGIWETATGKLLTKLPIPKIEMNDTVRILSCTPDFSVIVGNLGTNYLRTNHFYDAHTVVWDGTTGKMLRTLTHKAQENFVAISLSSDGKRFVTTNGGGATVWNTSTGQQLLHVPNDNKGRKHSEPDVSSDATSQVWSIQLSPDGKQLAMGDILGVKLLDATSGKLLQQLEGPYRYSSNGSPGLVFSKDGQWLARLGTQERAEMKNYPPDYRPDQLPAHTDTGDKTSETKHRYVVPIWSTRTGARLLELHTEANDAAFSDDGQRLAVVFSDMQQALSVWPLSVAELVRLPMPAQNGTLTSSATTGPGPHSRQDRVEENGHHVGKTAAEFIDKFQPTWGDTQLGLQYGIALTKPQPQRKFRSGERVPLVVFFRNASDKPIKFDTAPDFFGNTPKVLNAKGEPIALENIPLLGHIPHYHEQLAPGEALGPFYLNFGLGENPRPGQQHWHPYFKTPVAGQYKLTHLVSINVASPKEGEPSTRADITSSTIEFEIVDGDKPVTDGQANNPPAAALANQIISLADAVRDFNVENKRRGRGLDQPPLTEDEVVAAIKRSDWKRDAPDVSEREFSAFKTIAETRQLPKGSELEVLTGMQPDAFTLIQLWSIRVIMPALERAGTTGFSIRHTKISEEKIDPKSVAWGKPDSDGLSLGLYLSPKKDKYQIGERVQLRLFVRNEGKKAVDGLTFMNITWPVTNDFTVTDQTGAKVAVRNSHEEWSGPIWVAGAVSGRLDPGDAHAFRVPFEVGIGGDGSNKLIGRVIDARPGQSLQLRVRSHNGSDRKRADKPPEPESGNVTFAVEDELKTSEAQPRIRNWTAILVDGMTNTPLQGITLQARGAKLGGKEPQLLTLKSDALGRVEVPLADGTGTTLQVTSVAWWTQNWPYLGELPRADNADSKQPASDPAKPSTIKLWKGTHVTGRLLSPDGVPAPGVALNVGVYLHSPAWKQRLGMSLDRFSWDHGDWPNWDAQVVTNADGTFETTVPSPDARSWVRVGTTQLGFGAIDPAGLDADGPGKGLFQFAPFETEVGGFQQVSPEKEGRLDFGTLKLERGIVLRGQVLDADGQPLTGVTLMTSGKHGPYAGRWAVSGENGRFDFLPMNSGGFTLSADARLRDDKGEVRSRDVQAVFVPLEVTLPETGEPLEITVRAVPHVTVEFEWIDRRAKKGPVSYYGEFTVNGRVPREGTSPAWWRGETEKIERDGRDVLMMKIPTALTIATLNLPADSIVTARYEDDQTKSGPGQIALGDVTIKRRRIIYGDEPKRAEPVSTPASVVRESPDPAPSPNERLPKPENADNQTPAKHEGVIEAVADKAIEFDDGKVITTDAATKYARLTDKGEVPAGRKELKAGVRVRYELVPGKGATKVVILAVKKGGERAGDEPQDAAKGNLRSETRRGQETRTELKQAEPQTEQSRGLWSVSGRVVDGDGKPMPGVLVTAHTGAGTLKLAGNAETDTQGQYEFRFGRGILLADNDVQLQAATITAHKPGYFEKNLSRQGDLLAAMKLPENDVGGGKKTKDDVILPNKPKQIDFVMLPAARLSGTLIDKDDKPLAGYGVSLTGDKLPPSSSVIASVKTDEKGRFAIADIPTGFKFQILVEPSKREPPWNAWASGSFDFRISSGDEFFIQQPDREVAANRFELQVIGEGVNWKEALKIGAAHQKLEPTGDYLTTESRLHAATIRLTLNPPENELKDDQARRGQETRAEQDSLMIPLNGDCLNANKTPVHNAEVILFRERRFPNEYEAIKNVRSDETGRFDFGAVPELDRNHQYYVAVRVKGSASAIGSVFSRAGSRDSSSPLTMRVQPGATLQGTIVGPDQKPVVGAKVSHGQWKPGVHSSMTDGNGQFIIDDLPLMTGENDARSILKIFHPELGWQRVWFTKCPDTLNIQMVKPAVVEGTAVLADGSPAKSVCLLVQSITEQQWDGPPDTSIMTDEKGRYRFVFQNAGKINIMPAPHPSDLITTAIDSMEVVLGETRTARPLRFTPGGIITGKILDADTGQPILPEDTNEFFVAAKGESWPLSGGFQSVAYLKRDGSYRFRVAPGEVYPFLQRRTRDFTWRFVGGAFTLEKALTLAERELISLQEGETREVDFLVKRAGPKPPR